MMWKTFANLQNISSKSDSCLDQLSLSQGQSGWCLSINAFASDNELKSHSDC